MPSFWLAMRPPLLPSSFRLFLLLLFLIYSEATAIVDTLSGYAIILKRSEKKRNNNDNMIWYNVSNGLYCNRRRRQRCNDVGTAASVSMNSVLINMSPGATALHCACLFHESQHQWRLTVLNAIHVFQEKYAKKLAQESLKMYEEQRQMSWFWPIFPYLRICVGAHAECETFFFFAYLFP